jgi:hypothetical protein
MILNSTDRLNPKTYTINPKEINTETSLRLHGQPFQGVFYTLPESRFRVET